jgi:hypothetical protein
MKILRSLMGIIAAVGMMVNSNSQRGSDNRPAHQESLFGYLDLDLTAGLKSALAAALHDSKLSRDEVADLVNKLAARSGIVSKKPVTRALLDKWSSASATNHVPPVRFLVLTCRALEDFRPLEVIARACGCRVVDDADWLILSWAKAELAAREARKQAKKMALEIEL